MQALLIVALGGALGSVLRYKVGALVLQQTGVTAFPYGTFTVNVAGCLVAGLLIGLGEHVEFLSAGVRLLLFTGFLGGFTTFSAFGVETIALVERGAWALAALYVVSSVLCGLAALWLALKAGGLGALPGSHGQGRCFAAFMARNAKKARRARKQPDAIELLKRDHAEVKKAFRQFEKAKYKDPNACKEFVASICNAIEMHATVEEEIFYPAVRARIKDDELMNEAQVEHESAKTLIAQIGKLSGDDPMLKASASVLSEYVRHHVREEENEIFPKAKRAKLDLEGMAQRILERKDELKRQL